MLSFIKFDKSYGVFVAEQKPNTASQTELADIIVAKHAGQRINGHNLPAVGSAQRPTENTLEAFQQRASVIDKMSNIDERWQARVDLLIDAVLALPAYDVIISDDDGEIT